ncbi:MAG: LPS export ABC transporter permease LptF [Alphaproteobacteria bacterium]|nr:LPS export ABC transporter permease LptF [Alphaproteobacteria bacterium]
MKSLDRYLLRQSFAPSMIATVVVTAIVWVTQSLQRADMLIQHREGLILFLRLTVLIVPSLLAVVIPFALFAGTLYALQRLYSDSEIAVMFASGVSRLRIAAPLLLTAAAAAAATLWVNVDLMPWSYRLLKHEIHNIRADVASTVLRSGEFTSVGGRFTIYVEEALPHGRFSGLLVNDYRQPDAPSTYMARRGILRDTTLGPVLDLADGSVQRVTPDTGAVDIIRFTSTQVNIGDFTRQGGSFQLETTERYLPELFHPDMSNEWDRKNAGLLIAEGHNRLASPLYAFAFVLIALYALVGGAYSRRGQARRIAIACAAAGGLRVAGFLVQGASAESGAYWLQYATPLGAILVLTALLAGFDRRLASWLAGRR